MRKYHQSEIQTFLKCGKQWEFRYVQGIKTPPKAALTVGSSVDTGVTANLQQKIQTGNDLPLGDVLDLFSTDFDSRAQETEWDEDESAGAAKDVGAKLMTLHHKEFAPAIKPASVQTSFEIPTEHGFSVGGTWDIEEVGGTVVDTKTAKSKYADDAAYRALQPAMYDFAYEALRGKKAKGFRYDVLIKPTKTLPARSQRVIAKITEGDRNHLFDTIKNVDKAIKAGVSMPAPEGSWWCSKDWCGYWNICKGKK